MSKNQKKERLDTILVEQGFFETKSRAQAAVMAGKVRVNGHPVTKAGHATPADALVEVIGEDLKYVSRGGLKLEKALQEFGIEIKNRICLDAGASTGGFTDCLLQNGAEKVYAVDVGYGQIAWKLRSDERVITIERTNIRNATVSEVYGNDSPEAMATLCVMDLSFISVIKVLGNIKLLLSSEEAEVVTLIKPQFEAGKDQVPKTGVIKDRSVHVNVIKNVIDYACNIGLNPVNLTYSPIKGPAGNIEYLVHLKLGAETSVNEEKILEVTGNANEQLQTD